MTKAFPIYHVTVALPIYFHYPAGKLEFTIFSDKKSIVIDNTRLLYFN